MPAPRRPGRFSPPALLAAGLVVTIAAGTVLLRLPVSHAGVPIGWLDALFTATSAACVTGLVVVDTGTRYSGFGQAVILLLIQIGGLGVMTFGTLVMLALGRRPTLLLRHLTRGFAGERETLRARDILGTVIVVTLTIEAVGAALLFSAFREEWPAATALWLGVFHSVSAFCNAGFSLWSDSLTAFAADPLVNVTVASLVVAGGLGFVVLLEIRRWVGFRIRRQGTLERFSVHSRIVLSGTAIAIVFGIVTFLILEAGNVLSGRDWGERLLVSFFQSITARTAGFNTVPIDALANPTLLCLMLLMFVGAGPGSMAGGIKITAAAAVFAFVKERLRGRSEVTLFGRAVGETTLVRAVVMSVVALMLIACSIVLLEIVRHGGAPDTARRGEFLAVAFETVSAFGTVGLSMGLTTDLGAVGKVLVIVLMFVGRLGPLALMDYFAHRPPPAPIRHATEELMIA